MSLITLSPGRGPLLVRILIIAFFVSFLLILFYLTPTDSIPPLPHHDPPPPEQNIVTITVTTSQANFASTKTVTEVSTSTVTTESSSSQVGSSQDNDDNDDSDSGSGSREEIPNVVHLVYILADPSIAPSWHFKHYLTVHAINLNLRPSKIILHTNANTGLLESLISTATTSPQQPPPLKLFPTKWTRLILTTIPTLTLNPITSPNTTVPFSLDNNREGDGGGKEITFFEHQSDFARVAILHEHGGIYLDFDAIPLRSLSPLRKSGFSAVVGRQHGGQIQSGTFMAVRGSRLLGLWRENMARVYDGGWTTHSNNLVTSLGSRLVGWYEGASGGGVGGKDGEGEKGGEVLIMEQDAFTPLSWRVEDERIMYQDHLETPSLFDIWDPTNSTDDNSPPTFPQTLTSPWSKKSKSGPYPLIAKWEHDFSTTYILHAFDPYKNEGGNKVKGFRGITPRYVMERRSNFARAVYPVVRDMVVAGVVGVEDSGSGRREEGWEVEGEEEGYGRDTTGLVGWFGGVLGWW